MSIKVMSAVWRFSKQKGSPLLMLLAIGDFANDEGVAFPSIKTLAEKTRMSERTVQYLLSKLEQDGEITVDRGAGPHGCNRFVLPQYVVEGNSPRGAKFAGAKIAPGVQQVAPGGCNLTSKRGAIAVAPNPSIEPSLNRQSLSLTLSPSKMAVDSALRDWARQREIPTENLEQQTEKFLEHARAHGWRREDWEAARHVWLLNAKEIEQRNGSRNESQSLDDVFAEVHRRIDEGAL